MNELAKKMEEVAAGKLSEKEFTLGLGPGCVYNNNAEREVRYVADKPIEHWIRQCRSVTGCTDPSDNYSEVCGSWSKEY